MARKEGRGQRVNRFRIRCIDKTSCNSYNRDHNVKHVCIVVSRAI